MEPHNQQIWMDMVRALEAGDASALGHVMAKAHIDQREALAEKLGSIQEQDTFIQAGASRHEKWLALLEAIRKDDIDRVRHMLDNGAPHQPDPARFEQLQKSLGFPPPASPLEVACGGERPNGPAIVELLIDSGVPLFNPTGAGGLDWALYGQNAKMIISSMRAMLAAGVDPNHMNDKGRRPLNQLFWSPGGLEIEDIEEIAAAMVQGGADPALANKNGETAYAIMVQIMSEAEADAMHGKLVALSERVKIQEQTAQGPLAARPRRQL